MYTSQSQLLLSALNGATDQQTSQQLLQAFANCNQALTHRGTVNLSGAPMSQSNGMMMQADGSLPVWSSGVQSSNGLAYPNNGSFYGGNYYGIDGPSTALSSAYQPSSSAWLNYVNVNPYEYSGAGPFVYAPSTGGYRAGDWITYQGDNNTFDLAPRITDTTNQYYGGPTFQVAGDTVFQNTVTKNSYVTNVTVQSLSTQSLNGDPVQQPAGDPKLAGPGGVWGWPGNPGMFANNPAGMQGGNQGGNPAVANQAQPGNLNGQFQQILPVVVGGGGGGNVPGNLVVNNFNADLGPLQKAIKDLQANVKNLRDSLQKMNLKAVITDDCEVKLCGKFPNVLGGVKPLGGCGQ